MNLFASSVHFDRKPNRKRVCGSLNRTSQNHSASEPNRTGTGQNHALYVALFRESQDIDHSYRPTLHGTLDLLYMKLSVELTPRIDRSTVLP